MRSEQGRIEVKPARQAFVVRLTGDLTVHTAAQVAASLDTAAAGLGSPALLILDLRRLSVLSSSGVRVLLDIAAAAAGRGVGCRLVAEPAGVVADVLDRADPGSSLPRFADLEQAWTDDAASRPAEGVAAVYGTDLLVDQIEALTRTLLDTTSVGGALRQVVDAAVLAISGADVVSVTLRAPGGELSTPVETDPIATDLDQVQYRSGKGPCVDSARPDMPGCVTSDDLSTDDRWPEFAAMALSRGCRAVLSTELLGTHDGSGPRGTLNVYSRRPGGFTAGDRHAALLLATHAALALAHNHTVEVADLLQAQLREAIDSRDVIGQAKGILMNRQHITAQEAFTLLRRTSQDLNIKLVDLARTLTDRHSELDAPTSASHA